MLDSLSWSQFVEWQAIYRIEPFGELREDWRNAHLCHIIALYAPFMKNKGDLKVSDFLISFNRDEEKERLKKEEIHLGQLRSLEAWMMPQAEHLSDREGNLRPNPAFCARKGGLSNQGGNAHHVEQVDRGRGLVSLRDMVKQEDVREIQDLRNK